MNESLHQDWIGRRETASDYATAQAWRALRATLDYAEAKVREGDPFPLGAHWMFARPIAAMSALARDGHPAGSDFLPPIALPRRMWAGSRVEFGAPLVVGDRLERVTEIISITPKTGSTGELVFVTVRHSTSGSSGGKVVEDQSIVYRDDPKPDASAARPAAPRRSAPDVPAQAEFSRRIVPDTALLFRYSALSFNTHRIHYDQDYVTRVEGYPGLVVQGQLLASLMLDLMAREMPGANIASFDFSARRPVTLPMPFEVKARREGEGWHLWIDCEGVAASVGRITVR